MVKIGGNSNRAVCRGVPENIGLEKADVKQTDAGNETHYLAFIALKSIAIGREPPSEPKEGQRDVPDYAIPEPKERKGERQDYHERQHIFAPYSAPPPDDKGDKLKW